MAISIDGTDPVNPSTFTFDPGSVALQELLRRHTAEWVALVDVLTRRMLHTSQHIRCPIWLAGRLQEDANAARIAVGLEEFGWNDAVRDEEVGRCSVHPENCEGQHTHGRAS